MDNIKANNKYDSHLFEIRLQAHCERWQKYFHTMDNYRKIIRKHSQGGESTQNRAKSSPR